MACDKTTCEPEFLFTVHTPTFNRAHTLKRVYDSLKAQTFTDFEWLIVDDGSDDNSDELISSFIESGEIPIRYFPKKHEGKPAAVMTAVEKARGELFLILDSDDSCVPDALETFSFYWLQIPLSEKDNFIGVTGHSQSQDHVLVGSRFPADILDSDGVEIKYRYKMKGEKWGFLRTEVLRKIPWPQIEHDEFVPEGVWWTQLAKHYKTRYINKILRTYYSDSGTNRLMDQKDPRRFPVGHMIWHRTILNDEISWFWHKPLAFFRSAIHFIRFSCYAERGLAEQWRMLSNYSARIICFICLPAAAFIIFLDKFRK